MQKIIIEADGSPANVDASKISKEELIHYVKFKMNCMEAISKPIQA
jgi:hypothetical protein